MGPRAGGFRVRRLEGLLLVAADLVAGGDEDVRGSLGTGVAAKEERLSVPGE